MRDLEFGTEGIEEALRDLAVGTEDTEKTLRNLSGRHLIQQIKITSII